MVAFRFLINGRRTPMTEVLHLLLVQMACAVRAESSTKAVTKGKYYYEVACHDQGLCRVGWSTAQASLDLGMFLYDLIILICFMSLLL
ncbi:hypothetical protein cypCar_00000865 [Cyprinus carpio]|nr:hypothetical protein cypCar_00000865 [Cyprinus carpio]